LLKNTLSKTHTFSAVNMLIRHIYITIAMIDWHESSVG
jgi:hypothetical protein